MSASPVARQALSHADGVQSEPQKIPKKIVINSASELPCNYSTTPGGTMFSTTPGGTRIIYERSALLNLRNSPLAKSPLKNLPNIPGVTVKEGADTPTDPPVRETTSIPEEPEKTEEQFSMDL